MSHSSEGELAPATRQEVPMMAMSLSLFGGAIGGTESQCMKMRIFR